MLFAQLLDLFLHILMTATAGSGRRVSSSQANELNGMGI